MKCVIGVGNPGGAYEKTRHNIGFRVVDALKKSGVLKNSPEKVILKKPRTFVNRTGQAVAELRRKHGMKPEDFLIVCDDVNLELGRLRLRAKGSAGGHKGLQSVIDSLGTEEFPRLRVGVKSGTLPEDLTAYVLGPFGDEEQRAARTVKAASAVCAVWAKKGLNAALDELSRTGTTIKQEK